MTKTLFAGAIASGSTDLTGAEMTSDTRYRSRHALIDQFGIDCDEAAIILGPVARKFHGISDDGERIGIRPFLDCYEPSMRTDLVELIEKFAGEGQPFHFTARLASPAGAVVHGFLEPATDGGARRWTGMLVMSPQHFGTQLSESAN